MDPHLANALSLAWGEPRIRDGLHDLLDLPQTGALLHGFTTGQHRVALMDLLQAGTAEASIQQALLAVISHPPVQAPLLDYLAGLDQVSPELMGGLRSSLADPRVIDDLRTVLGSEEIRQEVWATVRARIDGSPAKLVWHGVALIVGHRKVRRLGLALHRHGVLRALRHLRSSSTG